MSVTLQYINTGSSANAGNGDSLRTAFNKINSNFRTLSTQSGGTGTFTLEIASTSTLGGIKVGAGLVIANDGVLSATGTNAASVMTILDQNGDPRVDVMAYTDTATLSTSNVHLFSFDKTIYKSATIEFAATNNMNGTNDVAPGYVVNWVANATKIFGYGPIAMDVNGDTGNAEWDLTTSALGDNIRIDMVNVAGNSANGHTISWNAKVSLFKV